MISPNQQGTMLRRYLDQPSLFGLRRMQFKDVDDLIGAVLNCVERHIEGRNPTVRNRREAIVAFFHRTAVINGSEMPDIETLLESAETALKLFVGALESTATNQVGAEIRNELITCVNLLFAVVPELKNLDSERSASKGSAVLLQALLDVFDWTIPTRLQAYVFACTGECIDVGLLGKERTLLLEQVRRCAKELINE